MKKVFWVLVVGAVASAAMAIGLGRAEMLTEKELIQYQSGS